MVTEAKALWWLISMLPLRDEIQKLTEHPAVVQPFPLGTFGIQPRYLPFKFKSLNLLSLARTTLGKRHRILMPRLLTLVVDSSWCQI